MPVATRSVAYVPSQRQAADNSTPAQWKVLVVDENSRKLINAAVKEEEILNLNVSSELVRVLEAQTILLRSTFTSQTSNRSNTGG